MKLTSPNLALQSISSTQLVDHIINSFQQPERVNLMLKLLHHHAIDEQQIRGQLAIKKTEQLIAVPTTDGCTFIHSNDLIRLESDSNYCWFHHADKGKVLVSKTLKYFELRLEKFNFIRVHQSHMINPNFILKFVKTDGGHLVMKDGSIIPISRNKRSVVMELLS